MSTNAVLTGSARWHVEQADCLDYLRSLPADCCNLVFGSPPYRLARTYGIDFKLADQSWDDWMVQVYVESLRVCTGLVAFVLEGQTRNYRWTAEPAMLMADLHRKGINLRRPCIYHRVGIPGSGGPDWLRADTEYIVCATRPGRLPWSDNTACGHPPKWAPGGEMSNRLGNGTRVNQWGHSINSGATIVAADGVVRSKGKRPSHYVAADGSTKAVVPRCEAADGDLKPRSRKAKGEARRAAIANGQGKVIAAHDSGEYADSTDKTEWNYVPPVKANPGNLIKCKVGGGLMGSPLAHENEAPFPEALAEFFVRSYCQPGGLVIDPFSGSGTTAAVAVRLGRRALACDVRESQVALSNRRIALVQPELIINEVATQ